MCEFTRRTLESIEFTFENCESFEISVKYIGRLMIDTFERTIERVACNAVLELITARNVQMEIFSEADEPYATFGVKEKTKFQRLTDWNDITHLALKFSDGSEDYIGVLYDEGEDAGKLGACNIRQTQMISKLGNLYLVIDDEKKVDDVFPADYINDEHEINFSKEMYGVHDTEEFSNE